MAPITLDRKTFEALAIDTRVKILKSLKQRRKTQAELAKELKLAASTISEHLGKMMDAGLLSRQNQGKKWVYYSLTEKARTIVEPRQPTTFVFALSVSLMLAFLGAFTLYGTMTSQSAVPDAFESMNSEKMMAAPAAMALAENEATEPYDIRALETMALIIGSAGVAALLFYRKSAVQ